MMEIRSMMGVDPPDEVAASVTGHFRKAELDKLR